MQRDAARSLRVVAVDEEPYSLKRLCLALAHSDSVVLVGSFDSADALIGQLLKLAPDVIVISANPGGMNGLEFVEMIQAICGTAAPAIVLTSAVDDYAISAFEVGLAGYLLKPVDFGKLEQVLATARRRVQESAAVQELAELRETLSALRKQRQTIPATPRFETELWVPWNGRFERLQVSEIDWIEAEGDYVRIHARGKSYLLRETMARIESRLGTEAFARVHRSALVYQAKVALILRQAAGRYALELHCGTQVPIGRSYWPSVQRWINGLQVAA